MRRSRLVAALCAALPGLVTPGTSSPRPLTVTELGLFRRPGLHQAAVLDLASLPRARVAVAHLPSVAAEFPGLEAKHLYVDALCLQMVRAPETLDVIVTNNLFGDIVTDLGAGLQGGLGMAASANVGAGPVAMFEPVHGSAPDIAGQDKANPLATLLSLAMMFRYTFARPELATRIEAAVRKVLAAGVRTADIAAPGEKVVGTRAMGDAVVAACARELGESSIARPLPSGDLTRKQAIDLSKRNTEGYVLWFQFSIDGVEDDPMAVSRNSDPLLVATYVLYEPSTAKIRTQGRYYFSSYDSYSRGGPSVGGVNRGSRGLTPTETGLKIAANVLGALEKDLLPRP